MSPLDDLGETLVPSPETQKVIEPLSISLGAPITFPLPTSGLAETTISTLKAFFDADPDGNHPNDIQWMALRSLATTLEKMATGRCEPFLFLSSADPGTGKTKTLSHFVRALRASNDYDHVGVIICVGRLSEIGERESKRSDAPYRPGPLITDMDLREDEYAVLTSNKGLNALGLGSDRVDEARVLITTQQRLEQRGDRGYTFDDLKDLYYRGQPRQVRAWDETALPGRTITVSLADLSSLYYALGDVHKGLAEAVKHLRDDIESRSSGSFYSMPDLARAFNLNWRGGAQRILSRISPRRIAPAHAETLVALGDLSNKLVSIRRDVPHGNTLLDYRETLPKGLAPLVIMDASGRVRQTYAEWENRGGFIKLPSAAKSYRNLNIRLWRAGGGKTAWRDKGDELCDGVAAAINSKRDEEFLVIYHRDGVDMDIKTEIRSRVIGDKDRVQFLNWGQHQATNQFREIPNVILAGTLFMRDSYYEALTRLTAATPPGELIDPKVEKGIRLGEHKHQILQALCRARVRGCQDGVCLPCDAWVIASGQSGITKAVLEEIFPCCNVETWQPIQKPLSGKVNAAIAFIVAWCAENRGEWLAFKVAQKAIGVTTAGNFKNNVRNHPAFIAALEDHGIVEEGRGWRRTADMFAATERVMGHPMNNDTITLQIPASALRSPTEN